MASIEHGSGFVAADDFALCKREARNFALLFVIQTLVMIGLFLALGYWRTDDPLGFPLGMPSWFVLGAVVPSLVFLVVSIVMALRMQEVPLS